MNRQNYSIIFFVIISLSSLSCRNISKTPVSDSGNYRNVFVEMGICTIEESDQHLKDTINQLFYGDSGRERIYYEFVDDMAYILDVNNNDIRSEGVSYGMMFCVQLDMKTEFDKLWKYAHEMMLHKEGDRAGYFAWEINPDGSIKDENQAPDGEEYFAASLLMASNCWGDGEGMFNYSAEANKILNHMIRHQELAGLPSNSWVTNMIHPKKKQVVFVPYGNSATFTDPSYHLPHFYELFALWADSDNELWGEIAQNSRTLFQKTCHPDTGLAPDYAYFDGSPVDKGEHDRFYNDAWRVSMNISMDSYWWNKDPWQRDVWVKKYLDFFSGQGVSSYSCYYNLDGSNPEGAHSAGVVAMNATAALIGPEKMAKPFVEDFWNTPIPSGQMRYFDGCLYLFGLLNLTGNYRIITAEQT